MKVDCSLILVIQLLTCGILIPRLLIYSVQPILQGICMVSLFILRSDIQRLLEVQFLLCLTSSFMRRVFLAVNHSTFLVVSVEIIFTIITKINFRVYDWREGRRSFAFHHSHHLSLQYLWHALIVHQAHVLICELSHHLATITLCTIAIDSQLLEGITQIAIAEFLQLGNILVGEIKLAVELLGILESGILTH